MAKVTAIITSFKRDIKIVERAVRSILNQTFSDIEVLVVDDNAPDSEYSKELKKLCKNNNITYLTQNANKGACSARNYGIKYASGDYIGFLDDDDEWMPEKISKQLAGFEKNPNAGLVYCRGNIINEETNKIIGIYNENNIKTNLSFQDMLTKDYIGSTSQPLVKKECFEKVGGFWEEQPARQDYEMWLRISQEYPIAGIEDILFIHNMHEGEQISRNFDKSYRGYKNILHRYKDSYKKYARAKKSIVKTLCGVCIKKKSIECFYYGFMYFGLTFKAFFENKNKK